MRINACGTLATRLISAGATVAPAQTPVTTDAGPITPDDVERAFPAPGYSPYAGRAFPTQVFWGDQHLHTSWSGDAAGGGTRVGPAEAFRLARGEEITSSTGQAVKLSRPLDWLVVADHSDALGLADGVIAGDPDLIRDPVLREWNRQTALGGRDAMLAVMDMVARQSNGTLPPAITDTEASFAKWRELTGIVEGNNNLGRFTALIGYERTSNAGGGDNLHRNVIYSDGKILADRVLPLTTFDSENSEDLWARMAGYEAETGGRLLAIPHNGNLSNGRMFELRKFEGGPLTTDWAESRARWKPLCEVTQGKGTSEQHPALAPADEFAGFEIWDYGNLNIVPKTDGMIETEYAREALKTGLRLGQSLGSIRSSSDLPAGPTRTRDWPPPTKTTSSASSRPRNLARNAGKRTPSTSTAASSRVGRLVRPA